MPLASNSAAHLILLLGAGMLFGCAPAAPAPLPEPTEWEEGEMQPRAGQVIEIPPLHPRYRPPPPPDDTLAERGLEFRLREGAPGTVPPLTPVRPTAARGTPLSAAETSALLRRLPPLPAAEERNGFLFPTASPPPPRTGALVLAPFPPPDTADAPSPPGPVAPAALEVVRITPAGEVRDLAPHLTITFSQPMVPLSSVAEVHAREVPVRLSPQPPGRWQWIDTRTLRFEPQQRFPMATHFTVEVPAGIRSELGGTLPQPVRAGFATPAPRAIGGYPHRAVIRSVALEPIIVLVFDQRIDPAAALRSIEIRAGRGGLRARLATEREIAADSLARVLIEEAPEGRWLAIRPVQPLPRASEVRVVVRPGALSAEGPRTTEEAQELPFRSYGPLAVEDSGCAWMPQECPPGAPWNIRFSNPLDLQAWSDAFVRVEPEVPDLAIRIFGEHLTLAGDTRAHTNYRVMLDPDIRDVFGQRLEASPILVFSVGDRPPMLRLPGGPLLVVDPDAPPQLPIHSRGYGELRIRIYRVQPEQWHAFTEAVLRHLERRGDTPLQPPGEPVADYTVRPEGGRVGFSETRVDLSSAFSGGLGHAVVVVDPGDVAPAWRDPRRFRADPGFAWVQATRIGLSAAVDNRELLGWATSLETGEPLGDVELRLLPSGTRGATDAQGLATLPLSPDGDGLLVARRGRDVALLPDREPLYRERGDRGSWRRQEEPTELSWYLFTDRGLYRPGEEVRLKGWMRQLEIGRSADPALPRVERVGYTLAGPRGEELGKGEARPGALGGFDLAFELPEAINLGHATVRLEAHGPAIPRQGRETGHHFAVQEFRRPEYEVTLEVDPGPHVVGTTLAPTLRAAYFGGGGLAEAEVEWRVMSGPAYFTPPGWTGWSFGRPQWPWGPGWRPAGEPQREQLTSRTDTRGVHRLLIDLVSVAPPFPANLNAAAEVRDVNRQAGSASQHLVIHPAMIYAGLRAERAWIRPGDSLVVRVIAVDPGGGVAPGRRVAVRAERMEWQPVTRGSGEWSGVEEVGRCDIVSGSDPIGCTFVPEKGGTLRITAEVRDEAERPSRTEMIAWVAGGPPVPPRPDRPAAGEVQLVPDREEYQPGRVAEILVQPPFHPAEATLTVRRGGILETRRFRIESEAHILRLPITEAHLPSVQVHVELVDAESGLRFARGEARLSVPPRRRELAVRVLPRDSVLEPGGETVLEVEVRRSDGRPAAGAEVALWMVDEAVLSLGAYQLPDPLDAFYPHRHPAVRDHELRSRVVLTPRSAGPGTVSGIVLDAESAMPLRGVQASLEGTGLGATTDQRGEFTLREVPPGDHTLELRLIGYGQQQVPVRVPAEGIHLGTIFLRSEAVRLEAIQHAEAVPPPAAPPPPPTAERAMIRARDGEEADMAAGQAADPVALRADFAPLALFEPSLRTGADGRVRVPARLPGSLTRYRVMAVAVEGTALYGRGEAPLTARRELMARPSLPRFLNFGDRVEIPVVVQNLTPAPLEVNVALRASGLTVEGPGGQRVTVPAEDRVELRFPALADQVGRARVQVVATSGNLSDAAALELPVYTPATTEAFATYGEIDTGAPVVLPVQLPGGVIEGFGGLEITTTSTALQQLTDAVLYLQSYPFEGAEQLASRILGVAALRDVLGAFAAEGLPPPQEIAAATTRDIRTLVGLQNPDGGWSYWRRDLPSVPFVSIHAAHALQRAREKDFAVSDETLQRAQMYLREIERHLAQEREGRTHGEERARHALVSYALYVRHRMGDQGAVREARQRLQATRPELLTVEAMGWLLHTLAADVEARMDAAELVRRIRNRAEETAATATFATSYGEGEHLLLHSDRRSDAVVLEGLIAADPQSDLIPKVARSLLAHRVQGRWRTTQENAWVLLALERYFTTYERVTPDFRARVWLGDRFAGDHAFRGRTTERHHLEIPLRQVAPANGSSGDTLRSAPLARENLILAREGEGRMYYRAGLRYAPADLTLDPAQRGFIVSRTYEAVDDTADVRREADGTWRVRAGARVRVRVSMIAPSRRYHVALADPLPAGFEPLNPELAGVGFTDDAGGIRPPPPPPGVRVAPDRLIPPPWRWQWYIHQNLRDDRAEAFADLLSAGSYEYVYLARATIPGQFVVPPPRAEELYHPETFGRGGSDRVVVEAGTRR